MEDDPISLSGDLSGDVRVFRDRFRASDNADVIIRRFRSGAFFSALVTIDGMTDTREIDENILKPCMALPHDAGADVPPEARVGYLMENAVSVLPTETKSRFDELIADALSGQSVLLCDGCACACVMDTRGFEKRAVGRPEAEQVVLGPHESFGESIRTNITLLRRIVQREELMTEFLSVGGAMKTRCALLYLRGTADEAMLARVRRRLAACQSDFALSAGEIEQIIEDHPMALIPQCVATERPDRAASFLAEGQIVVLTDGSPLALGAPSTLWHQLHTPDDASMRWQYGTFLRVVRLIGMLIHLFLPGAYIAVIRFHTELISPILLASVYETSSRVPTPIFLEALLMTLAPQLVGAFSPETDVIRSGVSYLRCIMPFYVLFGTFYILNGAMRGAGDSVFPMVNVLLSLILVRVPVVYLLANRFGPGAMYYGIGIGWCVGFTLCVLYYLSGRWKRHGSLAEAEP